MAIELSDVTPSIALFNAQVARGDAERRQEQADFRQRYGFEQQQGLDKGIRGIFANRAQPAAPAGNIPGSNIPAAPPMPPAVAPAQAQPIAPVTAQPESQWSVGIGKGPRTVIPNAQDMGNEQPLPTSQTAVAPPSSSPTAPATAATPAIAGYSAPATAQAPRQRPGASATNDLMSGLANIPGSSGLLMQTYTADQTAQRAAAVEDRKIRHDASMQAYKYIHDGNWQVAKAINDEHRLGIPEDVFKNKNLQVAMQVAAKSVPANAKPEQAFAYMDAYMQTFARTRDEGQAAMAGNKAAQAAKPEFEGTYHFTDDKGEVILGDKRGNTKGTGRNERLRKFETEGGGGSGGEKSSAKERIARELFDEAAAAGKPITKAEAYDRASRADPKGKDDIAKERLALSAAKNDRGYRRDPTGTLNRARRMYGLRPVESAPADDAAPAAPRPGGAAPGNRAPLESFYR